MSGRLPANPVQLDRPSSDAASSDSAYTVLAAIPEGMNAAPAFQILLRRLVEITGADGAQLWLKVPGRANSVTVAAAWSANPARPAATEMLAELHSVARLPGAKAWATVGDGKTLNGVVTLTTQHRVHRNHRRELADTAACLAVLERRQVLQEQLRRQNAHTARLAGEVQDSARRLAGVRDLERRRIVAELVAFSRTRLDLLEREIEQLTSNEASLKGVHELRAHLERVTRDFRALARGLHSRLLHQRGVRAALNEVAAASSARIRITGDIPSRVDPEVSTSLYRLAAACLEVLAPGAEDTEIEVFLGPRLMEERVPGLHATILSWAAMPQAVVASALASDNDRIRHLGGRLHVHSGQNRVRVEAWVPDRLEPLAHAASVVTGDLHSRVRGQVLALMAWYPDGSGTMRARRLLDWLDEPVHVAVRGLLERGRRFRRVADTIREQPDLLLVSQKGRTAMQFPAGEPGAAADVIVQPTLQEPDRCFEIRLAGGGMLSGDHEWHKLSEILGHEVVAQAGLLRARTVLNAMVGLVSSIPPSDASAASLLSDLEDLRRDAEAECEALYRPSQRPRDVVAGNPVSVE